MTQGHLAAVIAERDTLAERVRQLEAVIFDLAWHPSEWEVTPQEAVVLNLLSLRAIATNDAILQVLNADRDDGGAEFRIINVLIHRLRRKLCRHGIAIHNVWGTGYRLDPDKRLYLAQLWKATA